MKVKQCAECRDGEHENYTDQVDFCIVRDPETGKVIRRAYLCTDHQAAFLDDGYEL